jgi:hypothetical protein
MVDEKHPLPWTLMEDINEIHEFRTVQRSFHNDKLQEKLRKIYELQGRMGLFYLGRDRAFRTYYVCVKAKTHIILYIFSVHMLNIYYLLSEYN